MYISLKELLDFLAAFCFFQPLSDIKNCISLPIVGNSNTCDLCNTSRKPTSLSRFP